MTDFDLWSAQELGRIIARSADWHEVIAWEPAHDLSALVQNRHLAGAAGLARAVGTSKITTWYWLTGKARPSLPLALHVYHRLGDSLATRLGCPPAPVKSGRVAAQPEFHLGKVRRVRKIDWPDVARQMQAELTAPINDARPLGALATALAIPVRSLRAHFPDMCLALAARYRSQRRVKKQERDAQLRQQIQAAMAALNCRGCLLAKRRVAALLGRPGLFNSRYARRIYDEARAAPA